MFLQVRTADTLEVFTHLAKQRLLLFPILLEVHVLYLAPVKLSNSTYQCKSIRRSIRRASDVQILCKRDVLRLDEPANDNSCFVI
jgi:hypothetical protein